jgi:hypothetical protein
VITAPPPAVPTPEELRLADELRAARTLIAALSARLETLQAANEQAYRDQASRGPLVDPGQPFGTLPAPTPATAAGMRKLTAWYTSGGRL